MNYILIFILLRLFINVIFKPSKSVLSCGLFGFFSDDPKKFNKDKYNILGIINDSRGGDSCGVGIDGDIHVGIHKEKLFTDYIYRSGYDSPKEFPIVLGHTRKSSVGSINIANAHPFGFGNYKGKFAMYGVHNGTLRNYKDLAKKYNIDLKRPKEGKRSYRENKVDSEILLEILYKTRNFKVLSEYNGGAALMWSFAKKPNEAYIFHGESKEYSSSSYEVEERPLYYYQETKNISYVSSIKESLLMIADDQSKVKEVEHNTVYKIKDGNIEKATKWKISRKNCHQKDYSYGGYQSKTYNLPEKSSSSKKNLSSSIISEPKNSELSKYNIYNETKLNDVNKLSSRIYFSKLRYWNNGHLINGIYVYLNKIGFYYLATNEIDALKRLKELQGLPYTNGVFLNATSNKDNYPVPLPKKVRVSKDMFHYFVDGVKMKDMRDYKALSILTSVHYNQISFCSTHPIIDLEAKSKSNSGQGIVLEGELFTGNICPLGSEFVYEIKNGNCLNIESFETIPGNKVVSKDDFLKSLDDHFLDEYIPKIDDEKFYDTIIDRLFGPYQEFSYLQKDFAKMKHPRALELADAMADFNDTVDYILDEI